MNAVTLIDPQDNPIGEADVLEAHRGEGKLHRAVSVLLFRKNPSNPQEKQLLIQQRSQQKIVGAGQWANTVCGNVRPDESHEQCAHRRLREELGIKNSENEIALTEISVFQYQVKCNSEFSENEIDHVYVGEWDGQLNLNSDEVKDVLWVDWSVIKSWMGKETADFQGKKIELAPWFQIILQRDEVVTAIESKVL